MRHGRFSNRASIAKDTRSISGAIMCACITQLREVYQYLAELDPRLLTSEYAVDVAPARKAC